MKKAKTTPTNKAGNAVVEQPKQPSHTENIKCQGIGDDRQAAPPGPCGGVPRHGKQDITATQRGASINK